GRQPTHRAVAAHRWGAPGEHPHLPGSLRSVRASRDRRRPGGARERGRAPEPVRRLRLVGVPRAPWRGQPDLGASAAAGARELHLPGLLRRRLVAGDPNLRITKVVNADLRADYFPSPQEVVSISAFAKDFT